MMKIVSVAAIAAASLITAAQAQAESPQTQYSQYLISHGMYGDVAPDGNTWLQDGQQVCAACRQVSPRASR
jgi:hypothetical protein